LVGREQRVGAVALNRVTSILAGAEPAPILRYQ
jgi:hypothetical protein